MSDISYKFDNDNDAKFIDIMGIMIPAWYSGVNDEYVTAKENVAFKYRYDLHQIFISGEDRNRLVDKVTTTNLSKIEFYNFEDTALCNNDGKIIDILKVYVFGDGILILSSFFKAEEVISILEKEKGNMKCEIMNISDKSSIFTFVGPKSASVLEQLTDSKVSSLKVKQFSVESFDDNEIIISRSDLYGKYTYDVIIEDDSEGYFVSSLEELNKTGSFIIKPFGFIAHNILRIEKGQPSMMNELEEASLLEAKLENIIKFDKGSFLGKEALIKHKEKGIDKSLFICSIDTTKLLIRNQPIYDANNKKVGYVTSSAYSPYLMKTIVMGFIQNSMNYENNEVYLKIGKNNATIKGKIISPI